jgi:PST family polysaccharide transporter
LNLLRDRRDSPADPDRPSQSALDRSLIRSVAWTAAAKWIVQVFSWITTIVVARLLSPDDYGLLGMAGVFLGVIRIVSEFGLVVTVVTFRNLSDEAIAQLNGLALIVGLMACGATVLAAKPLSIFFESDRLAQVIVALSFGFVLSGFKIVPTALLQRNLRFRLLAAIEAVASALLSTAMIVLAVLGFGYWTLVSGNLLSLAVTSLAVLWHCRVAFRLPRWNALQGSMQFTRHQLTGQLLWYTYSNADFLIAGKVLGEKMLGLYSLAWTLSKTIPEKITGLIIGVTPAYFSAIQDDLPQLRRYLTRITEAIAFVTFPALVGVALLAELVESVLLGSRWAGIAGSLRLLALYATVNSVTPLFSRVLTARRQTRFLMWAGVVITGVLITGFWVGSRWGVVGIAAAWLLLDPPIQLVVLRRTCRAIEMSITDYLTALWPASSMTAIMAIAVLLLLPRLVGLSPVLQLVIAAVAGAAAYAAAGVLFHRTRLLGMIRILRGGFQPVA